MRIPFVQFDVQLPPNGDVYIFNLKLEVFDTSDQAWGEGGGFGRFGTAATATDIVLFQRHTDNICSFWQKESESKHEKYATKQMDENKLTHINEQIFIQQSTKQPEQTIYPRYLTV